MNLEKLIDLAKAHANLSTDKDLCDALGISHGAVHHWKTGRSIPKPEHAQKLSELAGIDPGPVVAAVLIQATTDAGLKRTLERFKRAVAATFVLGATLPLIALETVQQCILCSIGTVDRLTHRPALA